MNPRDIAASVRDRLKAMSKKQNDDFQTLLSRYAAERYLFRIGKSQFASKFIVKGASLFYVWMPATSYHRVTRDIDLLGLEVSSEEQLAAIFREICQLNVEDDGMIFEHDSVSTAPIRPQDKYGGTRVTFLAKLANIKLPMQIDIGLGDRVSPPPVLTEFPTLLDFEKPKLEIYQRETAIAEKFHAMVERELLNSRLKDFYDIALLAMTFEFQADRLWLAISKTFEPRATLLPKKPPLAFTDAFLEPAKIAQWKAFVKKKLRQEDNHLQLAEVVGQTQAFLWPLLDRAQSPELLLRGSWPPGGPWEWPEP